MQTWEEAGMHILTQLAGQGLSDPETEEKKSINAIRTSPGLCPSLTAALEHSSNPFPHPTHEQNW